MSSEIEKANQWLLDTKLDAHKLAVSMKIFGDDSVIVGLEKLSKWLADYAAFTRLQKGEEQPCE